jgi:replication factor C subunit 3/5
MIIKSLSKALMKRVDDTMKKTIVHWAAHYDHRLTQGSKPIFHIEAFMAKIMSVYHRWIVEQFA